MSFDRYFLDLSDITLESATLRDKPEVAKFIGVFDRDEKRIWRFVPAFEREENPIRTCQNGGVQTL